MAKLEIAEKAYQIAKRVAVAHLEAGLWDHEQTDAAIKDAHQALEEAVAAQ